MLYTNYKQIAEITLNSQDAESKDITPSYVLNINTISQPVIDANGDQLMNGATPLTAPSTTTLTTSFNSKYKFKVNLLNPMSPNVRIAVKSFINHNIIQSGNTASAWDEVERGVGNIYIDNLYDKSSFNSDAKINNKFLLMTFPLCYKKIEEYYNNDILNTSKSIQNTAFMNNYLDIVVDARIKNITGFEIQGVPASSLWSLTLVVYDSVVEENPKAFSNGTLYLPAKY